MLAIVRTVRVVEQIDCEQNAMCQRQRQMLIRQDRILNIMGIGVRRASAFMSLGVRVADDQTVASLSLDGNMHIQFMNDPTPEVIRETQQNFRVWIIGNGLRELDQAASIFADHVFKALTLSAFHGRPLTHEAIDQIDGFPKKTNVADKFKIIADAFGVDTDLRVYLVGMSKARNALTHNMGIVGPLHTTHPGELQLSWIGPEIIVGDRVLRGPHFEHVAVEEAQPVHFRFARRDRTIPIGRAIELSPHDLHEICLTYWFHAQKLMTEMRRVFEERGIGPADPPEEPAAS
jgi:hypothetical protein